MRTITNFRYGFGPWHICVAIKKNRDIMLAPASDPLNFLGNIMVGSKDILSCHYIGPLPSPDFLDTLIGKLRDNWAEKGNLKEAASTILSLYTDCSIYHVPLITTAMLTTKTKKKIGYDHDCIGNVKLRRAGL